MLWACILLPHLAIDGVLRRRPPSDEPLVLVTGSAQSRSILAANTPARAAGLRPGQRLAVAQALLSRFETVEHDPATTERWHRLLAAWAYRYSAEVVLWPHAIVLEVSRSLNLFGPWPHFEALLRDDLRQLGFRHRIALAPTARAAYVLAGTHDGMAVMLHEPLMGALSPIPVGKARLPDRAAESLSDMGLRTLGQLLRAPRDGLRRRFGEALVEHLAYLSGEAQEVPGFYRPPARNRAGRGAGLSAAPPYRRSRDLPRRTRWRRAALHDPAGASRRYLHRRLHRPAHARARPCHAVRTYTQPHGAH